MIMPNLLWQTNHLRRSRYARSDSLTYCTSLTARAHHARRWHESCLFIEGDYES